MTVVHINEGYDVYIGRSKMLGGAVFPKGWGNPFSVEQYGREECIKMFGRLLWAEMKKGGMKERLLALEGKRLGCHCKPKSCHGDKILAAIAYVKNEG